MPSARAINPPCPIESRVAARGACLLRGFTLVELLVVVAIIGALVALLMPAVQTARESSRRSQCQNNLRQIGIAMSLHANSHAVFPVGCLGSPASPAPRVISWNVQLLPFLEQDNLAEAFDLTLPAFHPNNLQPGGAVVPTFLCASTVETERTVTNGTWRGAAFTDYGGIYGVEGTGRDLSGDDAIDATQTLRNGSLGVMLYDEAVVPKQVLDGLSKTASVAEINGRRTSDVAWISGRNIFAQEQSTPVNGIGLAKEIGSPHPGGALVAFCDAHVEFIAETIEQSILIASLTKAGGD